MTATNDAALLKLVAPPVYPHYRCAACGQVRQFPCRVVTECGLTKGAEVAAPAAILARGERR